VLAVALAGIGLGGYLYSLRDPSRAVTPSDLAVVTAIEGVFVALPIALGDRIALYAIATRYLSSLGFSALVLAWTSITAVVVFPAALASGYQFPLLFALLGSGRDRVARHVGTVYAFNTAGALLGSLLGGFVLMPKLTVVGCYRLVAVVLLTLALVSLVFDCFSLFTAPSEASGGPGGTEGPLRGGRRGRRRNWTRALTTRALQVVALVTLGFVFTAQSGPTAVFRHLPIGAGRVELPGRTVNQLRLWSGIHNGNVLWQSDGVETSVALTKADQLAFVVDGKSDGAVFTDRATQAGAGLIAALMHPAPKRSLVIGLGTGMTAGFLGAIRTMERVDVAELEPSILHVARVAAKANLDVLSRPNVTVHIGDGRELVLSARGLYDVIASEPSNPYRAGVASLYTKEFYEAVAAHLAEGGVFLQWVQGYETDTLTIQTVARTLSSVLPSLEAWQTETGDIVFIASMKHRVIDASAIRRRILEEPFRYALPRTMLIQDLEGLLGRYMASESLLSELVHEPGVELNTDDRNLIEYAFARGVGNGRGAVSERLLTLAMKRKRDRPDVVGAVDWERVAELRPRAWLISGEAPPRLPMPSEGAQARAAAVTVGCEGNYAGALKTWEAASGVGPRDDIEVFVLGMALSERGDDRATVYAERLVVDGFPAEASLLRARYAVAKGDLVAAIAAADGAMVALRDTPFPLCNTADEVVTQVEKLAQMRPEYRRPAVLALLSAPFATYVADDQRMTAAESIAASSGDPAFCVAALGAHLDHPLWDEHSLSQRLQCLSAARRPEAARAAADLLEYRSYTPGRFAAETD
jgi:spermidine synthase